jgi:hypothetical protein
MKFVVHRGGITGRYHLVRKTRTGMLVIWYNRQHRTVSPRDWKVVA